MTKSGTGDPRIESAKLWLQRWKRRTAVLAFAWVIATLAVALILKGASLHKYAFTVGKPLIYLWDILLILLLGSAIVTNNARWYLKKWQAPQR